MAARVVTAMTTSAFRLVCVLLALLAALGCGSSSDATDAATGPSGAAGDPGGPGATAGAGGAGSSGGTATGIPCEVEKALQSACGKCHGDPPNGGPMPLTSLADIHAAAKTDPSRKVYELMLERMTSEDNPMPPKSQGEMPAADKAAVLDWLEAGAPESTDTCGGGGTGGGGMGVGVEDLPCEPTHKFTAHALGSEDKYHVPVLAPANQYTCFTFKSPFDGKRQATAWAPIIDDERVIHHWILYRTFVPQIDGGVGPCLMPPGATFVAGWAPGGENMVMPEDVSLELGGPAEYFIMQVHYYNAAGHQDALDASGVAFCTTPEPREQTAGVITLGTMLVGIPPHAKGWKAVGHCPSYITGAAMSKPMNVIASFPHMHKRGRAAKTEIFRGGSPDKVDILTDVQNFAFDDQGFYPHDPPIVVHPGDGLRTTCTYDNPDLLPVLFGEGTEDEMCFDFVIGYPIQQLIDRNCMY